MDNETTSRTRVRLNCVLSGRAAEAWDILYDWLERGRLEDIGDIGPVNVFRFAVILAAEHLRSKAEISAGK